MHILEILRWKIICIMHKIWLKHSYEMSGKICEKGIIRNEKEDGSSYSAVFLGADRLYSTK